jgi:hypothetical protein
MTTVRYKGFRILAMPYRIASTRRWTVDIEIHRHRRCQTFSLEERYRTEREAEARCTSLARRIIDGEMPGMTVEHLRRIRHLWGPVSWLRVAAAVLVSLIGVRIRT